MELALEQAQISLTEGNFPVGAVLVIDEKLIDQKRNFIKTKSDWISHAEMELIKEHSSLIKKSIKNNSFITLYTTLEPCLMCLGAAALHRISRIVYACSDPFTGATCVKQEDLPVGYKNMWPKMEGGLMKEDSKKLLIQCMERGNNEKWKKMLELLEKKKEKK